MRKSRSRLSQVLWEITDDFCPRIIVKDGRIQWVSTIGPSHLTVNKLWLPSGIKMISWKSVSQNKSIKFIVIENQSKLQGIASKAFRNAKLRFLAIPDSVGFLGVNCFSACKSLFFGCI
jgi:hypothetical protein